MSQKLTLEQIQNFEGKYPKQLWHLFMVEMWERFCFYGMRGVLAIFMVDMLGLTDAESNLKYGAIQAFVYAFTFVGGIFADKILGFKKSLVFGGLVMVAGNLLIAADPHHFFYYGITLSIIGTGFFKPNISSMVGELYKPGDPRRDAGFGLFYSGINIGAFLGGIVCVYLGKQVSWNLAFLAAGIVMIIGVVLFLFIRNELGPIGDSPLIKIDPKKRLIREIAVYAGAIACIPLIFIMIHNTAYTDMFMFIVGPLAIIYFLIQLYKIPNSKDKSKFIAAFIMIAFSILFFAIFEQAGGSLALFANKNLHSTLFSVPLDPNIVNNSANSLYVIIFAPLLGLVWLWMAKKKIEPNTVVKFGLAFLMLAGAYYIFYSLRFFADENGLSSLEIFALAYFVVTIAELCLSPIGLSMVTKLSPKHLGGMMMGLWFLASAYGQYLAGILGAGMSSPNENASLMDKLMAYTDGYQQLALYSLIAGIIVIALSPLIRKLMQDVK
ncbi:peptide MFS transporter [Empedobacter falsenii]|uniref:Peptide MFS transporter n=2 Tax=Empedobacter TaxID=59734 RepID=A0ABY8V472_9FLAO|nr:MULTISPECIES: peptide MFS transporter [Empedobacter]MCA4809997.1 peptide MFS transporter [Empedobacter stercoris]NOJ75437.1 peptide MFS transporter [Empedobacter stercoris]QNT15426.1 peptide MFS transporter [Empedobacter stercoris]WIH96169.1 peptide MFS transporter [Empedobacter falsenii]